MWNRLLALGLFTWSCLGVSFAASAQALPVPTGLRTEGVPPLSVRSDALLAHQDPVASTFVAWHPTRLEMLVLSNAGEVRQLHRLRQAMGRPQALTEGPNPVANAAYEPSTGQYIVFTRDQQGDEAYQLFRLDPENRRTEALSERGRRVGDFTLSTDGRWLAYTSMSVDGHEPGSDPGGRGANTELRIINPMEAGSQRVLLRTERERIASLHFTPDHRFLLFSRTEGLAGQSTWRVELSSGRASRWPVSHDDDDDVPSPEAEHRQEQPDRWVWSSVQGPDHLQLQHFNLNTGERRRHELGQPFDVEAVAAPRTAEHMVAVVVNQGGVSRLRMFDHHRGVFLAPLNFDLPAGVISQLQWHPQQNLLAFTLNSARSPGEVVVFNPAERKFIHWTGRGNRSAAGSAIEPRSVRWSSFDGREIQGFYYPAAASFTGKRPVIINIHGGPTAQSRPSYIGRAALFPTQLGVALIYPNVRGSSGFGRSFQDLDNGRRREDAVKDLGALLDWIAQQPELDASRVMVQGSSYGGYLALAVATHYGERIAGTLTRVGISNLVSFLENTESYRRENRRVEYGDERLADMRQFQLNASPLTHASRIRKPLMVVHGMNDPRVPYSEAVQMVQAVRRNGTPVWFVTAEDEGHGFKKAANANYLFRAALEFTRQVLQLQP